MRNCKFKCIQGMDTVIGNNEIEIKQIVTPINPKHCKQIAPELNDNQPAASGGTYSAHVMYTKYKVK